MRPGRGSGSASSSYLEQVVYLTVQLSGGCQSQRIILIGFGQVRHHIQVIEVIYKSSSQHPVVIDLAAGQLIRMEEIGPAISGQVGGQGLLVNINPFNIDACNFLHQIPHDPAFTDA